MQVCYAAVLIQCGNQLTAGLIRECQSLLLRAGNTGAGSVELVMHSVTRVETKAGGS